MSTLHSTHRLLPAAAFALALLVSPVARAQVPANLPVQGFLTDAEGMAIDEAVDVSFEIFTQEAGGTALYAETQTDLLVDRGYFTAYVGSVDPDMNPLDLGVFRDNADLFVQVTVGSEILMPRIALGTVPYAAVAEYVDFENIGNLPASLEDGDQNTVTRGNCGAGEFVSSIDGATVTCDNPITGRSCPGGQFISALNGAGVSTCSAPALPNRTCPAGQVVTGISGATVTCAAPPVNVTAGTGLSLAGSTFSINESIVPRKDGTASQSFDSGLLFLNYASNFVGVNNASPNRQLDVIGDIEFTGNVRFSSPRTYNHFISAYDFTLFNGVGSDWRPTNGDYLDFIGGTGIHIDFAYVGVHLPEDATVTRIGCYYYDNNTSAIWTSQQNIFYRRAFTSNVLTSTEFSVTGSSTAGFASTTVQEASDSVGTEVIDNNRNSYWLFRSMSINTGGQTNPDVRLYGCRISYTLPYLSSP